MIMAVNLPPVVVLLNCLLFGKRYFTDLRIFVLSSLIVTAIILVEWYLFAWIAVTVRKRLPESKWLLKRLSVTILLIAIVQALVITLLFKGYDFFHLLGYELEEGAYYTTLVVAFFLNVMVTLVHEGFDGFERWKATLTETEQLKKAYTQSQLLGLRSQVNPHFLFNSLNSLSSLISEDEERAEIFLDELTKVYRYLLRGSHEQLVTLGTELRFLQSYYYLLKLRYGESIQLEINIDEDAREKMVTPLLLQTIFEYGFNANTLSKETPLRFVIDVDDAGWLRIENNLQQKQHSMPASTEAICNLMEKYKLLGNDEVEINGNSTTSIIRIPLLDGNTNTAA